MPAPTPRNLLAAIEASLVWDAHAHDEDIDLFADLYVDRLEARRAELKAFQAEQGAAAALPVIEAFLAGCFEQAAQVQDALGFFRDFVSELFGDWIRARRKTGADPVETARLLLAWVDGDEYGICADLECDAVLAFDRSGLQAYEQVVEERIAVQPVGSGARRRSFEILRSIHEKRRDVAAFAAVCEREGRLGAEEFATLAGLELRQRRPEQALRWVQRGLADMQTAAPHGIAAETLRKLERKILVKLGRHTDALESAWKRFERTPWLHMYRALMQLVPRGAEQACHERAMAAAAHAPVPARLELFTACKEWDRLAATVAEASCEQLAGIMRVDQEPIVRRLSKRQPALAAKLRIAWALDMLQGKPSRHYDDILKHLKVARRQLLAAGQQEVWQDLELRLRSEHRANRWFLEQLDALGARPAPRATDLAARARAAWARRDQRTEGAT